MRAEFYTHSSASKTPGGSFFRHVSLGVGVFFIPDRLSCWCFWSCRSEPGLRVLGRNQNRRLGWLGIYILGYELDFF